MELEEFLVKAKISTYATSGEGGEKILEDGSKELIFEDSERKYRDRYFGFNPFIGEEIVLSGNKAVWGMNYHGRIVSDEVDPRSLYSFLKKAMRQVAPDRPFRGPSQFQEGDWKYTDESRGTLDDFEGIEKIYFKEKEVYRLKYHGGGIAR